MVLALPTVAQSEANDLSVGSFLVASRSLLDPNFNQTVVLLLDYSEKGALGVIINRPTQVELGQMMPDSESAWEGAGTVWVGGPVAHWQMVLLIRSTAALEGAERVFEDVHFTASRLVLEQVLQSDTEFRTYAGYAGWGADQLEGEIERGSWHVLPGDPDMVFDEAPRELWRELINRGEAQWASLR
jgi:putative transcriptional regulator